MGCQPDVHRERIQIQLPASSIPAQKIASRLTPLSAEWGLSAPTGAAEVGCYLVAYRTPETAGSQECELDGGSTKFIPNEFLGLFPAGAKVDIEIPNGSQREFFLFALRSTSLADCPSLETAFKSASRENLSIPVLIGGAVSDISDTTGVLKIQASFTSTKPLTLCPALADFPASTGTVVTPAKVSWAGVNPTVTEGASAAVSVVLDQVTSTPVVISYSLIGGTASTADHAFAATGTLTVPVGSLGASLSANTVDDSIYEPAQTVIFQIDNVSGGSLLGSATETLTISDNDSAPILSLADASVNEGNFSGYIPVTLSHASENPLTFNFSTVSGTPAATASVDFVAATNQSVTIPAGSLGTSLSVSVLDDNAYEQDERVTLTISSLIGATNSTPTATLTITETDAPPSISINTLADVTEGSSRNVVVSLDRASYQTVSFYLSNSTSTSTPRGTVGVDFNAIGSTGTLTPGLTSATLAISTIQDALYEGPEYVGLSLSSLVNASSGVITNELKILDDDGTPQISVADITASESTGGATFQVCLDSPSYVSVGVNYATADGTAVDTNDYTNASGTVSIPPGDLCADVLITVSNDSVDENNEDFTLTLSAPTSGFTIADGTATATITNDDSPPTVNLSLSTGSTSEGSTVVATATLSSLSGHNVSMSFAVAASGSVTFRGDDYGLSAGTISIPAGATTGTVSITITDDNRIEGAETFSATLSSFANVSAGTLTVALATVAANDNMNLGTWAALPVTNEPYATAYHTMEWIGSKLFLFGGGTSGTHNPNNFSMAIGDGFWGVTSATGLLSGREDHTSVVTPSGKMIIWGGVGTSNSFQSSGSIYDTVLDTWTPTTSSSYPTARAGHTAVAAGEDMIIWGGYDSGLTALGTGKILSSNTWLPMATGPTPRIGHCAVWTGSKMIIWGGTDGASTNYNDGQVYDPVGDSWTAMSSTGAPSARNGMNCVWTGSRMIVWGGVDNTPAPVNTGYLYDPIADTWKAMATANAPVARGAAKAVWTGTHFVVWGGSTNGSGAGVITTGGIYDPYEDAWATTSTSGAPAGRQFHSATWVPTSKSVVIFGGENSVGTQLSATDSKRLDLPAHLAP